MPLYWFAFQSEATSFAFTRRSMSGESENATMSAFCPAATARLWSPEAPYDWVNFTFLPAGVAWNALMIFVYAACGVEYATSDSVTVFADVPLEQAVSTPAVKVATTATAANCNLLRTVPIGVFDPLVDRTAGQPRLAGGGPAVMLFLLCLLK